MNRKQKLGLTWIGKDKQPQLEPRILVEDAGKSYGDKNVENMLIHGDNLLALKALEQDYAGKIKCIYIDPPYNTGAAFEHYDDGLEHSLWLTLMRDRLEILRGLLSDDGAIWINIDDNEAHYLKVLLDEIFGRRNFVSNVLWQKRTSPDARIHLGAAHDHILVYAKNNASVTFQKQTLSQDRTSSFKNPDNDPNGLWASTDFTAQGWRPNQMYKITTPSGIVFEPPEGRCWSNVEPAFLRLQSEGRMWFGKDGNGRPRVKNYLSESEGVTSWTWWTNAEVGHNQEAKKEIIELFDAGDAFDTPKPERLLRRVLEIGTKRGDLVLDSFAGSGTTGAVAQKMGRRWIMVELGDHCETHCLPRLKKVCDGTDQGGISEAVGWKGGGGFKYYELAPSLLKKDKYGNWVISEEYNANMLAAAMAKHEGFKYSPDPDVYWKHGKSSEKDYIFTTTAFVQAVFIDRIHEEMAKDEHLLICCKKFSTVCKDRHPNIEIKKIPSMLLGRCEFGREDYSLNIVNMPHDPDEPDFIPAGPPKVQGKAKANKDNPAQGSLFGTEEGE